MPHPWSRTSRPIVASSSCGSRSSGCAPEACVSTRRRSGRNFDAAPHAARAWRRASPATGRCCGPGRGRSRRARLARVGSGSARRSGRAGSSGCSRRSRRSGDTGQHLPVDDVDPRARQRRGHVLRDRRGDQHLLGAGDQLGQPLAALGVELGEDVVEDQDRVVAVGAQQVVGRQPQRERERPGLAVARRTPSPAAVPSVSAQLVAVRTDQADAAVQLVAAAALDLGQQRLGELRSRSSV